ncbi:MAG: Oxidoreductase, family, partial [Myxococcaceae bacterium]|nr:Oxidoreductase, family [Myxococcaceae bacterium]
MGNNNRLLERGAQALGLAGNVIRRAESGCEGSGRCVLGCPNRRRQGMEHSYVPQALGFGARLLADTRALRVEWNGRRATGLAVERDGRRQQVVARKGVVLAAGAVHTPWLLLQSGLRGQAGARFTAHPGFSVAGLFDAPVGQLSGATQGYEVTGLKAHGLKFEALGLPPAITTARLPGAGPAFKRVADRLEHLGSWGCLVRPEGYGKIARSAFGGPKISLTLSDADYARMLIGVKQLVALFFAAGAREVLPGVAGAPQLITSAEQLDGLTRLQPEQLSLVATHLFGGAVLGTDASRAVVDPRFAVFGA